MSGRLPGADRDVALVELVNRVMDRGVVISGEIVVSVADVDLLYLNLNLLVSGVETLGPARRPRRVPAPEKDEERPSQGGASGGGAADKQAPTGGDA